MSATRRPRLPGEEWEDHKAEIRRLYLEEDRKLEGDDGVMDIMLRKHKFGPTKSQFETKFKKWGFIKHAKKTEWQILGQVLAERKLQGKVTDVYLRGERMKPTKVRKQTRRHRHGLATKSTLQEAGIRPSKGALFSAIYRKNTSLVRLFMDMKLDLEPTATSTDYALVLEAVKWGRYDLVKDLVLAGADLHFSEYYTTQTKPGRITFATPLVASIYASNTEITNLLLDLGAIYKDNARPTPLEVFNLSLPWASKARLDVDTPLTAALVMNNLRLADHLILLGADPYDNVAMKFATKNGNMSLVKYLLEAIQKRYGLGQPHYGADALHNALIRNDIAILEDLAKHADATSLYPLARAISHEGPLYLEMIRGFMQTGIDPDSIVFEKANLKDKRTALLHAISMDLPPRNGVSRTPLQCAAEAGTDDIFQYLLEHVDPNEAPATDGGGTALQLAAIKGHHHIATILLQKGANVNAAPAQYHGRMAFEGAAEHGRIDMMVLLSKHGLDLLGNDEAQYKQAIKLANLEGHAGAVQLVEQLYTTAKEENVRNSTAGTGDEMAWSNSYENGWIGSADSMEVAMDDYLNL
ncbi:ankyrin [Pleomassaria siparia CBS 279.74]|uniref:Ankyrin n=1 Tax=Pleomassaria siparia CBS 279.74 TaxID=1314801 RepID=A0A6G1JTX0_9PLEO|nr:ankyrin [Pleomassaria siparia CBS 279.74]